MLQHLSKFNSLISQLLQFKVTFDDEDKDILLLASLPSSYENLMTTLLYGKDTLKFEQVCHTPNSTGVIYVTILPPDFFFSQLESKLHLE